MRDVYGAGGCPRLSCRAVAVAVGRSSFMTTRRQLFAIGLAALLLAPVVLFLVERALTVYPTPETQTRFLRAYAPAQVFDSFRDSKYSSSTASGSGAGAGIGFATHTKGFDQQLVMRSSDRVALMAALDRDVTSLLAATGAQVISENGNDTDGIHLRYITDKSAGTLVIKPPELIPNPEQYFLQSLAPDEVDVWVRISIAETWYKSGRPLSASKQSLLTRLLM